VRPVVLVAGRMNGLAWCPRGWVPGRLAVRSGWASRRRDLALHAATACLFATVSVTARASTRPPS